MKKSFAVFLLYWVASNSVAFCDGFAPLPMPYVDYSVSIATAQGMGSGFFIQASNSVYLVTARHVLFANQQTNWTLRGPEAKCTYYSPASETCSVVTLNLSVLLGRSEVRYSADHDIAMVRFEECSPTNKMVVFTLDDEVKFEDMLHGAIVPIPITLAKKFDDVVVGSDIFLIGFPASIGIAEDPQIDVNSPLLRKGVVAGKNAAKRTMILDCTSFPGNSGGPVIGKEQVALNAMKFSLLGVMVQFVPFRQTWENHPFGFVNQDVSNSGYSVVEPMDTVLDMIWK